MLCKWIWYATVLLSFPHTWKWITQDDDKIHYETWDIPLGFSHSPGWFVVHSWHFNRNYSKWKRLAHFVTIFPRYLTVIFSLMTFLIRCLYNHRHKVINAYMIIRGPQWSIMVVIKPCDIWRAGSWYAITIVYILFRAYIFTTGRQRESRVIIFYN